MSAFAISNCINCKDKQAICWIYIENKGYGICKECYKWLGNVGQLIIAPKKRGK